MHPLMLVSRRYPLTLHALSCTNLRHTAQHRQVLTRYPGPLAPPTKLALVASGPHPLQPIEATHSTFHAIMIRSLHAEPRILSPEPIPGCKSLLQTCLGQLPPSC